MNKKKLQEVCNGLNISYNNKTTVRELKKLIKEYNMNNELNKIENITPILKTKEVKPINNMLSAHEYCVTNKITGFNRQFIMKKYGDVSATKYQWQEILVKENITNL